MRILLVMILSLLIPLYGWSTGMTKHIDEQCHIVEGEHHEEAMADHKDEHHASPDHETHDEDEDCGPDHCSDHCGICHVSTNGFVTMTAEHACHRSPLLKEVSSGNLDKLASIATRPDTPPPKV
ncbi:MAG: hypothetical protein P8L44_19045 [Opitutales bacterium]|jgi:hypothetical protein|nr:hypothetical protein [Opitutales bacterium]